MTKRCSLPFPLERCLCLFYHSALLNSCRWMSIHVQSVVGQARSMAMSSTISTTRSLCSCSCSCILADFYALRNA
jgi:hypothetical protein